MAESALPSRPAAPTLVLRPSAGWRAVDVREIWRFRDLMRALAIRDVTLRYRQTALGVTWVVLQPLLAAGIFAFVFGRVAKLPTDGTPYVVFAFAGLLGWNAFNTTVSRASTALVHNAAMVSKIFFPRAVLPLSTMFATMLDFLVALVLMTILMVTRDTGPGWNVLFLPAWLVLVLTLALGVGLAASALMVSYRDVGQIMPVALQMFLYISPVAYSVEAIPERYRDVFSLNPMVGILEGFRWSLVGSNELRPFDAVYSAIMAVVILAIGVTVFARMERKFADVI